MRTIRNSPVTGLKAGAEPAGIFQFLPDNCKKTCKKTAAELYVRTIRWSAILCQDRVQIRPGIQDCKQFEILQLILTIFQRDACG